MAKPSLNIKSTFLPKRDHSQRKDGESCFGHGACSWRCQWGPTGRHGRIMVQYRHWRLQNPSVKHRWFKRIWDHTMGVFSIWGWNYKKPTILSKSHLKLRQTHLFHVYPRKTTREMSYFPPRKRIRKGVRSPGAAVLSSLAAGPCRGRGLLVRLFLRRPG